MANIICEHPIKAIWSGAYNTETGKKSLTVVPDTYEPTNNEHVFYIPCGRCRGCRLHRASVWADRLTAELQYHEEACFITLTYNDLHLPSRKLYIRDDGHLDLSPYHSLKLRDFQLFMKRLRKKFKGQKIRYYCAFEYGETNHRPHMHVILFGTNFGKDRIPKARINGYMHYESETLNKLWSDHLGLIGYADICDVSWNDCAYVARYCMKKSVDSDYIYDSERYENLNYVPEFAVMSRRPGIGYQYFVDHAADIYDGGSFIATDTKSVTIKPNKYYDKLFEIANPEYMAHIREQRKERMWQTELETRMQTDKTYEERLSEAVVEHFHIEKKLIRSL